MANYRIKNNLVVDGSASVGAAPVAETDIIRKKEFDALDKKVNGLSGALVYQGNITTKANLEAKNDAERGDVYTVVGITDYIHESGMFNCAGQADTTLYIENTKQYITPNTYNWLKYYTYHNVGLTGTYEVTSPFEWADDMIAFGSGPYFYPWDGMISCNFTSNGEAFTAIRSCYTYSDNKYLYYICADGREVLVTDYEGSWIDENYRYINLGATGENFTSVAEALDTTTDSSDIRDLRLKHSKLMRDKFLMHTKKLTEILSGTYYLSNAGKIFIQNNWLGISGEVCIDSYGTEKLIEFSNIGSITGDMIQYMDTDGCVQSAYGYIKEFHFNNLHLNVGAYRPTIESLYKAIPNLHYTELGEYELVGPQRFSFNQNAIEELGVASVFPQADLGLKFIADGIAYIGITHAADQVKYIRAEGSEDIGKEFAYNGYEWEELGNSSFILNKITDLSQAMSEKITANAKDAKAYTDQKAEEKRRKTYFTSLTDAKIAAESAVSLESLGTEFGYYFGQTLTVVENAMARLYIIQPDKTLAKLKVDTELVINDFDGTGTEPELVMQLDTTWVDY